MPGNAAGQMQAKTEGTFSGWAAQLMNGPSMSIAERTAKAAEQTRAHLADIKDAIKENNNYLRGQQGVCFY